MDLMMKWHSGSCSDIVELCVPTTEKEKVLFAEYLLDVVRHGWNVSLFEKDLSNDDIE